MIGIDAGVLLKLFDQDEPKLAAAAERFVARVGREEKCLISPIVIAEFATILARDFKLSRDKVALYLERILCAPEFTIGASEQVLKAIERYRVEKCPFSDCLVAELNLAAGCDTTATFNLCAAKSAGFSLLAG